MATVIKRFGATDGWVNMPDGSSHYIFGFVDITGVPEDQIFEYRGKATLLAPLLDVHQGDEVYLTLTNLGLPGRPDLDDTHTIHWHGFPNQIPLWDGVPEASISVPVGRDFTYYYQPLEPGTYIYHCHFEPVEHIQMGMVGPLTVRPQLEKERGMKFVYNDPDTAYDREVLIFLTELDPKIHGAVADVQEFDWTEYRPEYWLISGRAYPDTVQPALDPALPLQPYSTLIEAYEGERVLLRFVNLGFQQHCIQVLGIPLKVVGVDAQQLRGYNGEDISQWRNAIYIAAGQTADVIFDASRAGIYPLYNRNYNKNTTAGKTFGGMVSEIRVLSNPL
ncbi:multicopper oxidase domain-containing protein [Desulfoscipio gibsoniae]|uniref:Putative multicopper oxidase n=1 Tax=Desulfoscipio gibsoniae DSM 7213 TaxID=767817 RepID=R4KCH7_9FIRM|nr:multicopper oxidase domain-containing protein [Desulfoscipio gibsoniae]AGL00279.1 putative multicopper oxidase [Desulfoscipio gibsoniae DSM 7213]